jgi:hypothetical protein
MNIGIVGHEAAKFNVEAEETARRIIRAKLSDTHDTPVTLVSGHCHLGGIDIWAEEIATELGIPQIIHAPKKLQWSGGYKERNLLIARDSDICICIVVAELPLSYRGMRFSSCYHCGSKRPQHVKSGGCWTAIRSKHPVWYIIHPYGDEEVA